MIGKYEVTQEQYQRVMGTNPSRFESGSDVAKWPVESVSWYDAVEFCNRLSQLEGLQKVYTISGTDVRSDFGQNGYRLPTEAEWEYAARGGNQSRGHTYSGSNNQDLVAWYWSNSGKTAHQVGTKAPNELGLFDLSGNVWEWCWDWLGSYPSGVQIDPTGASSGYSRVYRGGCWRETVSELRSVCRGYAHPDHTSDYLGFRVVRTALTTTTTVPAPVAPSASPTKLERQWLVEMVFVQGGTFSMGSYSGSLDEKPVHQVTVSSFMMGKYEVTQEQYQKVMGTNPSNFKSGSYAPKRPVEQVSWYKAVEFCNKLSEFEGLQKVYTINGTDVRADSSRNGYRLPTEAEWEYAAKGGSQSRGYTYSGSNNPEEVAWYDHSSVSSTTTNVVGTKAPNELGLYDMAGNVWEWCWDWYKDSYEAGAQTDPIGSSSGDSRVYRGGSWDSIDSNLQSANRIRNSPGYSSYALGFRVVRRPSPQAGVASIEGKASDQKNADQIASGTSESSIELVFVQGGTFSMGSDSGYSDEKPVHQVTVSSFMMGKYEITQEQFQRVMGTNPSSFRSVSDAPKRPVEQVRWYDAVAFCNRLSDIEGLQKVYTISGADVKADFGRSGYRLPTEAEWEYAARGGSRTQGFKYSGSNDPNLVAWYDANSGITTHAVGRKAPNEIGLYDMSGNVYEWCWDWYANRYNSSAEIDPSGVTSGESRVFRGNTAYDSIPALRLTRREKGNPGTGYYLLGFRVVRRP